MPGPFETKGFSRPIDRFEVEHSKGKSVRRERIWLHTLLFVLTLVTTTIFGFALNQSFQANRPFEVEWIFEGYRRLLRADASLLTGLDFSVPLLLILLTHEMGHYIAGRRSRVDASLPYFLPSPSLLGTFGAFIRIRSPIYTRQILFDIGISGPLAGFVALLPVLFAGILLSHVQPSIASRGDFVFGTPLLIRLFEWVRFPGVSVGDIALHPIARAAWAGLLATSINLLPIGQLDGGHLLYAFFGDLHGPLSRLFAAILLPIGIFFYYGWIIWAVVMFFLGFRHPLIYDQTKLDRPRVVLGVVALAVFVLSFSLAPVRNH